VFRFVEELDILLLIEEECFLNLFLSSDGAKFFDNVVPHQELLELQIRIESVDKNYEPRSIEQRQQQTVYSGE
jgi:3-hydroxymyristoyl/3-hydroxydecanoyl-(acyl carrier protein) dehydratase